MLNRITICVLILLTAIVTRPAVAAQNNLAQAFAGSDLFLSGPSVITHQRSGEFVFVFPEDINLIIGAARYEASSGVIVLESKTLSAGAKVDKYYFGKAYLEGKISESSVSKLGAVRQLVPGDNKRVLEFEVTGQVYITAPEKEESDPAQIGLYQRANAAFGILSQPKKLTGLGTLRRERKKQVVGSGDLDGGAEVTEIGNPEAEEQFEYPIRFAPAGPEPLEIESAPGPGDLQIATITQPFYMWQQQEDGRVLEMQADSAAVFYRGERETDLAGNEAVESVYLAGNVIINWGERRFTADEIFYNFAGHRAIATDAEISTFDVERGIPLFIRAARIRQHAQDEFSAEDVTITSSEFNTPQISAQVGSVEIGGMGGSEEELSDFDIRMRDFRLKYYDHTVFYWPGLRSGTGRPELPLRSVSVGRDSRFGFSLETRWYLARLLGLEEAEGFETTYLLDYYSKRGVGTGVEVDYQRENYFGSLIGYVIQDDGTDRLGRVATRRDIDQDSETRGRFSWLHRHYLDENWDMTASVNYLSDRHFLESFFRDEFLGGAMQGSYLQLRYIEDTTGLSVLASPRINDFEYRLEEMPSVQYHRAGVSVFDDNFTYYTNNQIGRFRQRVGDIPIDVSEESFTYFTHRSELGYPIWVEPFKIVPYAAQTFGFDDRSGFNRSLVDGTRTGQAGDYTLGVTELGVRASMMPIWKVYPDVESEVWDIDGLRHTIRPGINAAVYETDHDFVDQRNMIQFELNQVLQTRRGVGDRKRTVNWMELDLELVLVEDSVADGGPDRFIWNNPMTPLNVYAFPDIFNSDLQPVFHRAENWGPRNHYFSADYIWRISDTFAVSSDLYYNVESGTVDQYNIGVTRLVWPDLSYYIGSRYLRNLQVLDEHGSNAVVFSATYRINPRYTLVFSQQFDFDYGSNIRSDLSLIRKYHRMYYGLTLSADDSLDTQSIMFSIWPQGVPSLTLGSNRLADVSGFNGY